MANGIDRRTLSDAKAMNLFQAHGCVSSENELDQTNGVLFNKQNLWKRFKTCKFDKLKTLAENNK